MNRGEESSEFDAGEVVRREFGVEYRPDHLRRLLHDLGFSPQKPQRRASERNKTAIARWRTHDRLRIKKMQRRGAVVVFLDVTGYRTHSLNLCTWVPIGERPQ